jgi:hypothetical protein
MGEWMAGERKAPTAAREEAGVLQVWWAALQVAARHPLGLGSASLANELPGSGAGLGPGLSARDEFLQAAAEWGVGGLAGLLVVIVAAAWLAVKAKDRLAIALLVLAVVSMAGESLLLDAGGAASVWLALGLCLGATASAAAATSTSRASSVEKQPKTSRPAATRAG